MEMTSKVVVVTGAGQGLGWGIAHAFAAAGARVCVNDIHADAVERVCAEIERAGGQAFAAGFDVADAEAFRQGVDAILTEWGRIDVLVHAAIYMPLVSFEALSLHEWQRQLDVGLGGFFNGAKAVWSAMVRQGGGHIIGIASGSSLRGYTEEVAYCTVKHGLEGMVKALSLEAEGRNISINTMGPGAPIKPTRMGWDELRALPSEVTSRWADPVALGQAFVWLAAQPPARFSGLRFDAGTIVATLEREGAMFDPSPEKVTLYPMDFLERQAWRDSFARGDHREG